MAVKLGEYVLEKRIGKGGMGQVFLAKQESLDRQVAVKVLPKELAKDDTFRARFEREAKSAASLIHPNVIQMYSFGIEKGVPYFAMEYVEGEDLSVQLKRGDQFDIDRAVQIVRDTSKALECAHRKGMVHRDIKPSNIMITPDGSVKVMDFGLAKAAKVRTSITQTGLIMGTPPYMSPEQGKGDELDVRSDLYSLGIVFYELLTGTVPFHADTPTAVIYQHIYEKPRPLRELNPEVPEAIEAIVLKMLEKKPRDRYSDPSILLADLDAYETGVAVTATLPGATVPAYPKTLEIDATPTHSTPSLAVPEQAPSVSKALLAGIAGGIVAAAVLVVLLFTLWGGDSEPPATADKPGSDQSGPGATPDTQRPYDGQTPGTATPGVKPTEKKEGLLVLSALRAALPDDVRTVYVREAGEPREKARGLPFEDVKMPVATYVLTFERRGYRPREIAVEVTDLGTSPSLDGVTIEFKLAHELATAYHRGKELTQQEEYSKALLDLRHVEREVPNYKDTDQLIALCNQHLQRKKELDRLFHMGMQYYRDQEWDKAVETLNKLPADYENSGEAYRVLADARKKQGTQKQLQQLLRDAQDCLLKGKLTEAKTAANGALSIDRTNKTAKAVLAKFSRASQLKTDASQAEARKDYESALKYLRELVELTSRSQKEKDNLARLERLHKEHVTRLRSIESLLDEADFALEAENPETAIGKLNHLVKELDPDNAKAKVLLGKAYDMLTRKIIAARVAAFDTCFAQGKSSEIAELIDPEQARLRSEVAKQTREFFAENVQIISAHHAIVEISTERDTASVDAVFTYEIELTEARRRVKGSIKRKIKLVRRADTWYIAAIENLD
jgi:serine/threonine protein kinase/tetratricopeptide (TPR) repeat protein